MEALEDSALVHSASLLRPFAMRSQRKSKRIRYSEGLSGLSTRVISRAGQTAGTIGNSSPREAGAIMSPATSSRMETPASQAVLAKSVTVLGEIHSSEPLTIEGEVEGTIDVTGQLLTIAPNGNVRASVKAREIDVLGSMQGNVEGADKILHPQWRSIRGRHSRAGHCDRGRRICPRKSRSVAPVHLSIPRIRKK